jgi:hypothetical protein
MRAVNLDTLVQAGMPPRRPAPAAQVIDIWDKYYFPNCGIYALGDDVIIFTLITTAGPGRCGEMFWCPQGHARSSPGQTLEAEFDRWLQFWFSGHEAGFAAAEDFVITAKIRWHSHPPRRNALLVGARWYSDRVAALKGSKARRSVPDDADQVGTRRC